jgi:ABC-type phosphate/phosphonate transport system substrate-binding protein
MLKQTSTETKWSCIGKGTPHPHPERINTSSPCPICGAKAPPLATPFLKPTLIGLGIAALIGLVAIAARTLITKPCPFQDCTLTIGIIYLPPPPSLPPSGASAPAPRPLQSAPPQGVPPIAPAAGFMPPDYTKLQAYFQDQLTQQFDRPITVNVDSGIQIGTPKWIDRANEKLQNKQWDVAFTLSPLVAVDAQDNGYEFAVRMMNRDNLKTVLFARQDFPIDYVQDLTPKTRVVLADKDDLPGFYVPIFQLYGKEVSLELLPNLLGTMQKVMSGQADVGAGFEEMISRNPNLKILKDRRITILDNARTIPPGGVYLSPNLSGSSKALLKNLMLNAPPEVQQRSMYVPSQEEGDYGEVKQIKSRAEEIISCTDFVNNPVKLYCKK